LNSELSSPQNTNQHTPDEFLEQISHMIREMEMRRFRGVVIHKFLLKEHAVVLFISIAAKERECRR
jgi:hypothetical protein